MDGDSLAVITGITQGISHKVTIINDSLHMLRILTLPLFCPVICLSGFLGKQQVGLYPPPSHPTGTKGDSAPCRGTRCALLRQSRREGPFVRHQISPVPKAGPDRVSSAGACEGAKPEPRALNRVSVYTSRGRWIPPTGVDRGRLETGRREDLTS